MFDRSSFLHKASVGLVILALSFLLLWWRMQTPRNLALYKTCKAVIIAFSSFQDTWHNQRVSTLQSRRTYFTDKNEIQNFQLQILCLSSDLSAFFSCECLSVPAIHQDNNLERWSIQKILYFTNALLWSNSYDLQVTSLPTTAGHPDLNPSFLVKNCCSNKINHREKTLDCLKASDLFCMLPPTIHKGGCTVLCDIGMTL